MMASPLPAQSSRATSPTTTISDVESHRPQVNKTIDDLTIALANFSRAETPDSSIGCCCMNDDCDSLRAWADICTKLEGRLVLSAEVGQALLQRYEAFVRKQDAALSREASTVSLESPEDAIQQVDFLRKKLGAIMDENSFMESRIQELVIKTEMSEATTKTLQFELHEARSLANRLASQQSRSAGWELHLAQQMQERDDMLQERDAAVQRERQTLLKLLAADEKSVKLQKEIDSLQSELRSLRASRSEFSRSVLKEAKSRIETVRDSMNPALPRDDPESAQMLESLLAENEDLKKQVTELNVLLSEARDELEEVRDEVVEAKRNVWGADNEDDVTKVVSSPIRKAKSFESELSGGLDGKYARRKGTSQAIQTEPARMLTSATSSPSQSHGRLQPNLHQQSHNMSPRSSSLAYESNSSHDPHSETSSINHSDARNSNSTNDTLITNSVASDSQFVTSSDPQLLATIANRVSGLLTRMLQADVYNLTVRLKRQNLLGDPKQISDATIKSIVSEVAGLRLGREENAASGKACPPSQTNTRSAWVVSRTELRTILRLFRELFTELGALRSQLNNVIFDPALAHKLRKEAFSSDSAPKAVVDPLDRKGSDKDKANATSWISPIQKLFGQSQSQEPRDNVVTTKQTRVAPKQAPAVGATTTTVNVEFASGGVRGTGAFDAVDPNTGFSRTDIVRPPSARPMPQIQAPVPTRSFMGIFAGAPQPLPAQGDRGVPLSRNSGREKDKDRLKQSRGGVRLGAGQPGAINRSISHSQRPSRQVEAVVLDQSGADQPPDFRETLLNRTLRPRGLSDSSIHTSFLKDEVKVTSEPVPELQSHSELKREPIPAPKTPTSPMLRLLISKQMPSTPTTPPMPADRSRSPGTRAARDLASWMPLGDPGIIVGSPREESSMHRTAWARRGLGAE